MGEVKRHSPLNSALLEACEICCRKPHFQLITDNTYKFLNSTFYK